MLLLVELIFGTAVLWHGRRWLVRRLDETFGNCLENFDTDEDRRGWSGLATFLSLFVVLALVAFLHPALWIGMTLLVAMPLLAWTLGNLSSWRRLESGNPLRHALDPVLGSESIRPFVVRLWRSPALLPSFTFDGRIEVPSAFVRHFSPEEQQYLYLALAEEATARVRRRVIRKWILTIGGLGSLIFAFRYYFHSFGFLGGMFGPMFSAFFRGTSAERRLTLERLKSALAKTGDFAAAEQVIYRTLPEKSADKLVSELREWWAMQSPAHPTVAAMRNNSVSPTVRAGLGP